MNDPLGSAPYRRRLVVLAALALPVMPVLSPAFSASATEIGDGIKYVFMEQGTDSSMMSGSIEDMQRARAHRAGKEALLYIRDGRGAYLIRDAGYLRRAEAIFKPQQIVGAQQGELGRRQGELGKRQGELGRKQGELGRQQAEAPPRLAAELGRQQGELGRQQGELGRQQGELGKEQARLAHEANAKVRVLLAEAIQHGVAQRVN